MGAQHASAVFAEWAASSSGSRSEAKVPVRGAEASVPLLLLRGRAMRKRLAAMPATTVSSTPPLKDMTASMSR